MVMLILILKPQAQSVRGFYGAANPESPTFNTKKKDVSAVANQYASFRREAHRCLRNNTRFWCTRMYKAQQLKMYRQRTHIFQ